VFGTWAGVVGAPAAGGATACPPGGDWTTGACSTATATGGVTAGAAGSRVAVAAADAALRAAGAESAAGLAGAGKISRSLRTTGGSTVDDAERTNSPSSLSLVMTTLLSIPSSFASS
jgi:hypothetical protein